MKQRALNTKVGKKVAAINSFADDCMGPWTKITAAEDRENRRFERRERYR